MATFVCKKCGIEKDVSQFYKYKQAQRGHKATCAQCIREVMAAYRNDNRERYTEQLRRYQVKTRGISLGEYDDYMEIQGNSCFICLKHQSELKKSLAVDHDHATGKVRGLLCTGCNTALGSFNDDIELLKRAVYYLEHGVQWLEE